ncbi:MlaD family protein [Roseisolibacter sp. H3M3-2]|uniref:MlaD family protein n=1 Tax=Roseisolibacter sp. H3M3-2 TaxID=3031323 RepID=UPI0023DC44C3|nr:MlaD family protein [Roseisolibacter sp. H3M3-2]MDF1503775.1 MlaD family protein [Roseisolibacter sp. H3M3-2]
MRRNSAITWEQLRVAAVILVALVILGFGGYRLGQAAHLFGDRYRLIAFVPNANGLRVGGAVTVAGQLVGSIVGIDFMPPDADSTRNLRVTVELDGAVQSQVRADSRAKLRTQGLLGDKVFDISPGTPRFAALRANDTLPLAPSLDYDQIIGQASGAVGDVVELTRDLRGITGGIAKGEGTVGQLVTNRTLYDELSGTLSQTNALLRRLQSPNGTVGRLLDDPALYTNLVRVTASLDTVTSGLARNEGTVGKLLRDDSLYVRLVGITAGADSLMRLLTSGDGLAAKLLNDQQSYDQLNRALTELNAILVDVRRNPGRYTKGLIKVF